MVIGMTNIRWACDGEIPKIINSAWRKKSECHHTVMALRMLANIWSEQGEKNRGHKSCFWEVNIFVLIKK